jgi:hypothetical protein
MAHSKWIEHLLKWSKDHGVKYSEAMKDPKCKAEYKKGSEKGEKKHKKGSEKKEKKMKMMMMK